MAKNQCASHNVCYAKGIISNFAVPLALNLVDRELSTHKFISDLHRGVVTFYSFNGFYWWSLKVDSYPVMNSFPFHLDTNAISDCFDTMHSLGFVETPSFTTWRH